MRTFFISDTHFHHKNILKFEPIRIDFLVEYVNKIYKDMSAEEIRSNIQFMLEVDDSPEFYLDLHDKMLIDKWNSIVNNDDVVWVIGDFAFGSKERARKIAAQLKGHKRLVRGNHDRWSDEFYREIGFEYVSTYPVVLKKFFILSHTPMEYVSNTPFYNIFGHVHSSKLINTYTDNSCCVCVERHGLCPIEIDIFNDAEI